ncbi:MAG: hypothetical protein AABY22_06980 [Nanoarchaeota archaeon]
MLKRARVTISTPLDDKRQIIVDEILRQSQESFNKRMEQLRLEELRAREDAYEISRRWFNDYHNINYH